MTVHNKLLEMVKPKIFIIIIILSATVFASVSFVVYHRYH